MQLFIRTEAPEACIKFVQKKNVIASKSWHAHRRLGQELLPAIYKLLADNKLSMDDISSIAVFKGPGSFTGLRIGVSVANTLAYSYELPMYGIEDKGWDNNDTDNVTSSKQVLPFYGREPHITAPKK